MNLHPKLTISQFADSVDLEFQRSVQESKPEDWHTELQDMPIRDISDMQLERSLALGELLRVLELESVEV